MSTSKPDAATTPPGSDSVVVGSTIASEGLSSGDAMPVFKPTDLRSTIVMPVVSLPVPQVVGHAMCGFSLPGIGLALPIGALMYAMRSSGYVDSRLAAFAVSITEPPPSETKPSNAPSRANAAAASKESLFGSQRASV